MGQNRQITALSGSLVVFRDFEYDTKLKILRLACRAVPLKDMTEFRGQRLKKNKGKTPEERNVLYSGAFYTIS